MKRLWNTIAGLRLGFEEHFRGAGSISLFVGLACNLAFVGQVYFWPSMWHTTAFMFSYTDASYVAELLCALMLGWRLRRGGTARRGQSIALGSGPARAGDLGAVLRAVRGGHPRARACQLGLRRYLRRLSAVAMTSWSPCISIGAPFR